MTEPHPLIDETMLPGARWDILRTLKVGGHLGATETSSLTSSRESSSTSSAPRSSPGGRPLPATATTSPTTRSMASPAFGARPGPSAGTEQPLPPCPRAPR